jgi:hypothetical protein
MLDHVVFGAENSQSRLGCHKHMVRFVAGFYRQTEHIGIHEKLLIPARSYIGRWVHIPQVMEMVVLGAVDIFREVFGLIIR